MTDEKKQYPKSKKQQKKNKSWDKDKDPKKEDIVTKIN